MESIDIKIIEFLEKWEYGSIAKNKCFILASNKINETMEVEEIIIDNDSIEEFKYESVALTQQKKNSAIKNHRKN